MSQASTLAYELFIDDLHVWALLAFLGSITYYAFAIGPFGPWVWGTYGAILAGVVAYAVREFKRVLRTA